MTEKMRVGRAFSLVNPFEHDCLRRRLLCRRERPGEWPWLTTRVSSRRCARPGSAGRQSEKRRQSSPAPWRWRGATRQRWSLRGRRSRAKGGRKRTPARTIALWHDGAKQAQMGRRTARNEKRGRSKAASPEYQVVSEIRPSRAARYPFDDGTPRSRAPQNR